MKKLLRTLILSLTLWTILPLFQGQTFAYLEDKVYCIIEGEQLTIYVKKEEGSHKCAVYIEAVQQLAREKYDEVLLVITYINLGRDTAYRKEVFELKKEEFLKLVKYRTTILTMIQEFEYKFFVKYQESLLQTLTPYLQALVTIQTALEQEHQTVFHNEQTRIQYQQITQQILIIQTMFDATTLDEIIDQIPAYLYLKQALEWK